MATSRLRLADETSQARHDAVVLSIAHATRGYAVYTNTGARRAICVGAGNEEIFPDVILCDAESFIVRHVIEVETEDSITAARTTRWARIARTCRSFWLLVPPRSLFTAARLCRQAQIPARIGTWSANPADTVSVEWLSRRVPAGFAYAGAHREPTPTQAQRLPA